ncbi:MAG: hypothetical protein D0433_01285 [Candidatus Thermochlorobacter aerophilum]|jgi:hypothetical protein|uniref:Uncharacterized protein n=1 Tax=Candidatus Thermochlorobacter aerophilus TaxID=1868324 RepID=A0A395M5Q5_9BACT|nr:MAG: hypothetical protein D0433_01285 [Candidatus Thermochlorobacter aerophilum]
MIKSQSAGILKPRQTAGQKLQAELLTLLANNNLKKAKETMDREREEYPQNGSTHRASASEPDDEKIYLPEKGSIGAKIRERNQSRAILGGLTFTEVTGYGFAVLFFVLAIGVYFQLGRNPVTEHYGVTLSAVLALYGIYRFVRTQNWTKARLRRMELRKHRERLRLDELNDEE